MAIKRSKKHKNKKTNVEKQHRSRFAKRSMIKIEAAPLKKALLDENPNIEVEKNVKHETSLAPVPPLKKETELILERKQTEVKTNTKEIKKHATTQDSTVILIFQDEDKRFLTSPQIISGKRHEPIKFRFKDFESYDLIKIDGFTSEFVLPYAAMTFTYRKKDAGNIWIFCQDIDDLHFLQKPTFAKGKVDEEFTLSSPAIRNYTLLRARGTTHGLFTYEQQAVTYYYRRDTWKEVDYIPRYLKIKTSISCLDAPDGNETNVILAKDTVWQTFETITTTNDQLWYCLGGSLWIKYDAELMTLLEQKPDTTKAPIGPENLPQSINLQHNAMIDFIPGGELVLYDKPFGKKVGLIKNGQIVTLTGRIRVEGMQWFEVNGLGWTIREYLDLDP